MIKLPSHHRPTYILNTTNKTFQMRYCVNLYLNWHQKYKSSKFRRLNFLNKNETFKFDLLYFRCQLRYRFTQYLILKVSLVVFRMYVGFWCNSTFMLCYSILKIAILLHKWDIVKVHSGRTVIRANLGLFNSTKNSKNGRKGNIWKVVTFFYQNTIW